MALESVSIVKGFNGRFLLFLRVIDDECKFSYWYNEAYCYYVYSLVYLCHSLLEQQIDLVLKPSLFSDNNSSE